MAVNEDNGINPPLVDLSRTQATSPEVPLGVNNGVNANDDAAAQAGAAAAMRPVPSAADNDVAAQAAAAGVGATSPMNPGAGQHPDASQANTPSNTTASVNAVFNDDKVTSKPNILDNFSSYTYHASVYMLSPDQYKNLVLSKKKTINGYHLLFQSGGAPNNVGGFQGAKATSNQTYYENNGAFSSDSGVPTNYGPDAGRNPAFPLDFYIDSITIVNLLQGGGSRAAHAIQNIKFTVVEPVGITLMSRIYQAAQDMVPGNGAGGINYNALEYLMVIRFYGYDAQGNLVPGIRGADASTGLTDTNAVIEKFIPFKISKLDWSISNRVVTYDFEGVAPDMIVAAGTRRGTIPYDIQLTAGTVGDVLGADVEYAPDPSVLAAQQEQGRIFEAVNQPEMGPTFVNTGGGAAVGNPRITRQAMGRQATPAKAVVSNTATPSAPPPKASAAPTTNKIIKKGLMGAMNEYQQEIIKGSNPIFFVPDSYQIVWVPDKYGKQPIRDASIVLPGEEKESSNTGFTPPPTVDPNSAAPNRVSKDVTTRNFGITAGMQLVQAIDLAIRQSTYIMNQQLVLRNTQTGDEEPGNEKNTQPVQWYTIWFEAVPKAYDSTRNDTGYDITFYVAPFTVERYDSKYFPLPTFRGVHKDYQLYFTGKNTAVIDYKEQLNNLYNMTVSGTPSVNAIAEQQRRILLSSAEDKPFFAYQSASTESRQGTSSTALEPSSNFAESFYDPSGLKQVTMRILGDPAWIQQGTFAGGVNAETFSRAPFYPDGTINFDASQILFQVSWQRPEDYDLYTGLANANSRNIAQSKQTEVTRVYVASRCTSEFKQGKFEQTIQGFLYPFPTPDGKNKAASARNPNITAEVQARTGVNLTNTSAGAGRGFGYRPDGNFNPQTTQDSTAGYANKNATPARPAPANPDIPTSESGSQSSSTSASSLQPENPPEPTTSNGDVAGTNNFSPPAKLGQADIRRLDNAIAAGQNNAAFGVFRSPKRSIPQTIVKDD